jgi:hypothetical protein
MQNFSPDENEWIDENEDNLKPKRKVIELDENQKKKIKATLSTMQKNLVQPQISAGRKFEGPGFASKPGKIIYKDFEVGVAMSITIELTNISYSFNSFKLLPLDDEVIDFFEIDYKPCGRIPAGISTTMTLKFTPMVNKDYFSNLKLLSETGQVLVPIECLYKKCIINIPNPVIDYEEVILGQEIQKQLIVENAGALACIFTILDEEKNSLITVNEESDGKDVTDISNHNNDDNDTHKNYSDFMERKVIMNKDNFTNEQLSNSNLMKNYFIKQLKYPNKGQFESYSKKHITFILNAKYIGTYEVKLLLKIEYKQNTEYKNILFKFTVIDLPIYSDKKVYNLDYLIEDNIFREKLVLYNRSNISYKLQAYSHKDVNEYIELNPNLGYIQANSSFEIWVKLKVIKSIHELNKFFKANNGNENEFNIPLKIVITNITVPLVVVLNFSTTTDKIVFDKTFLNFDKCLADEATKLQISLESLSKLPMKYGFIMLPKEFTVKNNIDTILDNEKIFCDVTYESRDGYLGHREGDIFCRVVTNDLTVQNLKLKYHVELINSDFDIKPKRILFPAIPLKEKANYRIVIHNRTSEDYICEWMTPPFLISGMTIMPKVFNLQGNKFTTCVIEFQSDFRPYGPFSAEELEKEIGIKYNGEGNLNNVNSNNTNISVITSLQLDEKIKKELEQTLSLNPDTQEKKKKGAAEPKQSKEVKKLDPKKDKKQIEEEERKKKEEEEKRLAEIEEKKAQRIQNFNRAEELKLFGAEMTNFDDNNGKSEHWKFVIPLCYKPVNSTTNIIKRTFIEVSTTCVEKYLIFDKEEINFEEVSVQTRKTVNLTLFNKSDKYADIKMKPLIVSNCFQVVNSVREIPPNGSINLLIDFFPMKDLPYFDEFAVYTNDSLSSIKLKGKGVQPEIEVSVENGIFFLGNTCCHNTIEKSFEIYNRSSFNVNYEIKVLKSGKKNKNGLRPFCYIPYKNEIPAHSKINVKLTFTGDHQDFQNYYELILIDVPNQKKPNIISISAACWNRSAYWREFFIPSLPDENSNISNTVEQDYFIDPLKLKTNSAACNNDKLVLVFKKYEDGLSQLEMEKTLKRKVIIGNCKLNDNKSEKSMTYEIFIPVYNILYNIHI